MFKKINTEATNSRSPDPPTRLQEPLEKVGTSDLQDQSSPEIGLKALLGRVDSPRRNALPECSTDALIRAGGLPHPHFTVTIC